MCTVTWIHRPGGYELCFNRDELKTRLIAHPPSIHRESRLHYIAPIDADAGGTWIGVNQFGITICLLNFYHAAMNRQLSAEDYTSRGLLVKSLLTHETLSDIFGQYSKAELRQFRPFKLLAIGPESAVQGLVWDGTNAEIARNPEPPLSSSSFLSEQVIEQRRRLFREIRAREGNASEALIDYHRSHFPEKGPFSVCMHREEAHTVSFSRVVVTAEHITFHYTSGAPCETPFLEPVSMARVAGG